MRRKRAHNDKQELTLGKQINIYLRVMRGMKQSTADTYKAWFSTILYDPIMNTPITDIVPRDLRQWIAKKDDEGYSYSTINGYYTGLIRPALDMAVEDGVIPKNPACFKLTAMIDKNGKQRRGLTKTEVEILIDHLENSDREACQRNKGFIELLLYSGMRVSELCGLTTNDIDYVNKELHINKQLVRKDGIYEIMRTKSDSGARTIPITDDINRALVMIEQYNEPCVYEVNGISGFLLTGRNGLPAERGGLLRKYKNICSQIDKEFGTSLSETSLHSLRHTYCTNLISAGMNVKIVQYLMGHSNAATTLNIYAHIMLQDVKKAVLG